MSVCSLIYTCCVSVLRNKYDWLEDIAKKTILKILAVALFSVSLPSSPPYPCGTFDRILLDAPCSALGQRPQFVVRMNLKELQSYPRLQRKLFTTVSDKMQNDLY